MDTLQTNTTIISACLCVEPKKLWRWYRDHLSGFCGEAALEERYAHDIEVEKEGQTTTVRVPVLKPGNIGPNMAIDEKQIGDEMHTLLTNRDTGKLAMVASTTVADELQKAISGIGEKRYTVVTLTRDMSPSYAKFGNTAFPHASHIADKFHIIRELLECSQEIRVRYRQEVLREKRIEYEKHKLSEKQRKKECEKNGEPYTRKNFIYQEPVLSNGETIIEGLARSRYLLYRYPGEWTSRQKTRASALFEKYPELETAYQLACEFRDWIKKENLTVDLPTLKKKLKLWFEKVEQSEINEMLNFKSMIERNLMEVLNYFRYGATNAIAENINSRVQRFIMINQGTRDREFFYFRMANYFT